MSQSKFTLNSCVICVQIVTQFSPGFIAHASKLGGCTHGWQDRQFDSLSARWNEFNSKPCQPKIWAKTLC